MWQLNEDSKSPLYQKIIALVEEKMKQGLLVPGDQLPSERSLANLLQVNRSTVIRAFDELEANDTIVRKRGSGTIINETYGSELLADSLNWRRYLQVRETEKGSLFREELDKKLQEASPTLIDGYSAELPIDLIPAIEIPSISWKKFLDEDTRQESFGNIDLRQAIKDLMKREFSYEPKTDELLLTAGGQQGIFLIIHALLQAGDIVAIETPSFFYSLPIFAAANIKTVGIPIDREGLNISILKKKLKEQTIKMLFVNPSFQNPTGTTMTFKRRRELVELCQKYQVAIVEDDVFGFLNFSPSERLPLLKEISEENVIYMSSLTKVLGSTIQIGWLNAPKKVLNQMLIVRDQWELKLSIFPQVLSFYALSAPSFEKKLVTLKKQLAKRQAYLVSLIEDTLSNDFSFYLPHGGYYIWLTSIVPNLKEKDWQDFFQYNLLVMPSFLLGNDNQSLRINFARLSEQECQQIVEILKKISHNWKQKKR